MIILGAIAAGELVGTSDGASDVISDGCNVGLSDGSKTVGTNVGSVVGYFDGIIVGTSTTSGGQTPHVKSNSRTLGYRIHVV